MFVKILEKRPNLFNSKRFVQQKRCWIGIEEVFFDFLKFLGDLFFGGSSAIEKDVAFFRDGNGLLFFWKKHEWQNSIAIFLDRERQVFGQGRICVRL